jgi:hypothetical protein
VFAYQSTGISVCTLTFTNIDKEQLCEISGSHGDEQVDVPVLDCDVMWTRKWLPTFQRNILSSSSWPEDDLPISGDLLKRNVVCGGSKSR